jgi:ABC-type polysaccharide/polyol phosphate transport system ATPase subunit
MGAIAVELEGVGKRYRLGEHHGAGFDLREKLAAVARRVRGHPRPPSRDLWSLRDVSLSVAEGEALGIIGRNGAGKSTLLKVVSNITTPTEGRCRTRGRVGSLLEVGTGFHGELTGLENTFLNGAILGMSGREVAARLDDIVSFAGLEGFMDTPVKRYSSGMYLRLGFAIAAHMEAEILVVDEVLAVGDAEFQQRCLGKMREVERSGRTVLFVSHDLEAVARLCPRAVWLERGRVQAAGPTDEVVAAYLRPAGSADSATTSFEMSPDADVSVAAVSLATADGSTTLDLPAGGAADVVIDVVVAKPVAALDVAVIVVNERGVTVLDESLRDGTDLATDRFQPGRYRLRCPLPPVLNDGAYAVTLWLGGPYDEGNFYERALAFRVGGHDQKQRVMRLGLPWDFTEL